MKFGLDIPGVHTPLFLRFFQMARPSVQPDRLLAVQPAVRGRGLQQRRSEGGGGGSPGGAAKGTPGGGGEKGHWAAAEAVTAKATTPWACGAGARP